MRKLVLVALVAAGCGAHRVWVRPGSTHQDFARDKYDCSRESETSWSGGGTGLAGQLAIASARSDAEDHAREVFSMCMEARGWRLVEKRPAP
jgi:hypothetical protein